jgi:hypothetical protein
MAANMRPAFGRSAQHHETTTKQLPNLTMYSNGKRLFAEMIARVLKISTTLI